MEYSTLRIWKTTLRKLRHIYAETGESMLAIVDRLADQELKRIEAENRELRRIEELRRGLPQEEKGDG